MEPDRGDGKVIGTRRRGGVSVSSEQGGAGARRVRVLFVCLGNICRSPLAEGVFRALVERAGLSGRVEVESAGTTSYHEGEGRDPRAVAVAKRRGIELVGRARQVTKRDLTRFDLILAMDAENLADLRRLAAGSDAAVELRLLREFDAGTEGELDVPDPYYGGARGFEAVHDIVERSCRGLLEHVRRTWGF
jgi:protein-tyrosine phosphatase